MYFLLTSNNSKSESFLDPNLKLGLSYEVKRMVFETGYNFSLLPYSEYNYIKYKNQSFYFNIGFQIFQIK